MGDFDKLLKDNIEQIILALSAKHFGFTIERYKRIPEKLQLQEREVDFAAIVDTTKGERFLLHIEFQVKDDPQMLLRMAEYHGIWQRRYNLPIKPFVLFLGERKPRMPTRLPDNMIFRGFTLIDIHAIDPETMLSSELPEEVVLAVLGNFAKEQAVFVLDKIITRLRELSTDPTSLKEYVNQLTVLSRLRKLETLTIKIADAMPITYDVETDGLYQEGLQKGEERGILIGREEGREEGLAEGAHQKSIEAIQRILLRLPNFSDADIADLLGVDIELVQQVRTGENADGGQD